MEEFDEDDALDRVMNDMLNDLDECPVCGLEEPDHKLSCPNNPHRQMRIPVKIKKLKKDNYGTN